ncbi:MAG TPA: hypothetical protein VM597_09045, partial [Gemmataceae bacterium]|nr:hypothetical protein [Gemmataceae bacterium]
MPLSPSRPSVRLTVERFEDRLTPAYNLSFVGAAGTTTNVALVNDGAGTITAAATGPDAQLKVGDLQNALKTAGVTKVVVSTTDPAGAQEGDIAWVGGTAGDLDFAGFGTGKTLEFRAGDDIDLTDVYF